VEDDGQLQDRSDLSDHMEISLTQGRPTSTDVFARAIIRDIFAAGLHFPVKEKRER